MYDDMILILDFGGLFTLPVAQKLRGESVYCEILPHDAPVDNIRRKAPKGLILVGGLDDAFSENALAVQMDLLRLDIPVLGIGYGARALLKALGGRLVDSIFDPQSSMVELNASPLFGDLTRFDRFLARVDSIEYPEGILPIARTNDQINVAFQAAERPVFGMQFYAEQNDPDGLQILRNFACDICGCRAWWSMPAFIERTIESIRETAKGKQALMAISGGIDSTVCAVLMHQAIGENMHCLHIDTGLMRKGETELVRNIFKDTLNIELTSIDASERFLRRLKGVTDPAEKRRVVHEEFKKTFHDEAQRFGPVDCIVQGTIYTDILQKPELDDLSAREEGIDFAGTVDSTVRIEPTRMLFKNEVRQIGEIFGLPEPLVNRQPFPLSGLALRCLGEVTGYKLKLLREANDIFRDEIHLAGLDKRIWQSFVVLTDIRSASVRAAQDDYEYTVALRAVNRSGPIVTPYRLPYELLERVTQRITTEAPGINRVVYDVTGNPPAEVEWE